MHHPKERGVRRGSVYRHRRVHPVAVPAYVGAVLLILLTVTPPSPSASTAGHARVATAASAHPTPPSTPAPGPVPAQQAPDLTWPSLLRAGLPGFLASLGSGTVLAITAWGIKKLAARRGEP